MSQRPSPTSPSPLSGRSGSPSCIGPATPLLMANAWDAGQRQDPRPPRLRRAGDDECRLRQLARPPRRWCDPRRGDRPRRRPRRGDASAGQRRPRTRLRHEPGKRRRDGRPSLPRPDSPAARSRIGIRTARPSTTSDSPASGSPPPPRPPTPDPCASCSRPAPRTTSARSTTSTTRFAGCRRTPPPVPTSSTRRGSRRPSRSPASSRKSDVPVNVLVFPGVPSIAELAELGVARVSVGSGFALAAHGALASRGT